MSLYTKLLWLFIGVAILPLLIFAGVVRHQTLRMADLAAEAELLSEVAMASGALGEEASAAEAALEAFAAVVGRDPSRDLLERILDSGAGPQPDGFNYVSVVDEGGIRFEVGREDVSSACSSGIRSFSARVEVALIDGSGRLIGAYRPGLSTALRRGTRLWVYDRSGELVMSTTCGAGPGLPDQTIAEGAVGIVRGDPQAQGAVEALAMAGVPSRNWTVVAAGSYGLRAPLAGLFRDYWLFVLGLAGTTLLAFSVLLRSATGALNDLTSSVERVASGDLRPWFPTPRDDEIGRLTLAFHDMTDRLREMVQQVDRSSRLAVLGKLSAYLAHEIRNPLSAVKMNLQRLHRWRLAGGIPEQYGDAIEISLKEVGRLSAAVSNILQLSPGRSRPEQEVALHLLVAEVAELLDRDFARRGVALRWDLSAEADRILGDPGQLKGVIINLMLNALDAQPEGGELFIRSSLAPGGGDEPRPQLEIRFRDRGPGVPPDQREKIFEPFFTTKENGSGIGLAVVSQTLRDHGGEIHLAESARIGEGAEFVVRLPLAAVVSVGGASALVPQVAPWMAEPVATLASDDRPGPAAG